MLMRLPVEGRECAGEGRKVRGSTAHTQACQAVNNTRSGPPKLGSWEQGRVSGKAARSTMSRGKAALRNWHSAPTPQCAEHA